MKKIYFSFLVAALFLSHRSNSQQAQWLRSTPVNYNLNPEMPQQPACHSAGKIYAARLVDYSLNFGVEIFGSMSIDCYDAAGMLLWSFPIGQKVVVRSITADASGNVYAGGTYMETLQLGTDSLLNTGFGFDTDLFLFSLDATGTLRWKRNVSLLHADAFELADLETDPQENCWYALQYFDSSSIRRLDVIGNDVQSYPVLGTRTLNSFSFDPAGNIYLAGSSGSITLSVNGFSINVPEPYMMFVSRINTSGIASWIQLVHDVTFQSPEIMATTTGHAYVAGNLMDTATFGTIGLHGPQWVSDIFLTRVDSAGNFSWGIEVPETPLITGDFQRGKNNFIDVDAAGNVYLIGTLRGIVDWGNGVITDAGPIPSTGFSVISFSAAGIARWEATGNATGFVTPYSVAVSAADECYFAASVVGTTTFDTLTANTGGNYAFLLGKIGPSSSSAIAEVITSGAINVFPNPSDEFISIRSGPGINKGEVLISNVLGEKVLTAQSSVTAPALLTDLDIRSLPSGIYFAAVGAARAKFIVRHH
jgi:hypothetical protein